jgi:choline dehydrogenase-like flavoprotein
MTMPVDMWRGPMQAASSFEFLQGSSKRNGYIIEAAPGHAGLIATALPWEGTDAHALTMRDMRYLSPLVAITRDGGAGRVSLTSAGRVRVDYEFDRLGLATLRHAVVRMARLARAAGAGEIVAAGTPPLRFRPIQSAPGADAASFARFEDALSSMDFRPNRGTLFSAHQMGTIRMGKSTRDHPCDPRGHVRSRGRRGRVITGLYVADASLFPSALGVNPMLTVMALARRVARTVLAEA